MMAVRSTYDWWKHYLSFLVIIAVLICEFSPNCEAACQSEKQKVCIIGAGAAGLGAIKQFAEYPSDFDIIAFEKNSDVGGVWLYTDKTGVDEYGLPVQSPMYKNLITNAPTFLMMYPDYLNFQSKTDGCIKHQEMLSYLHNYTDHYELRQYVQLNTVVEKVTTYPGEGDWRNTKYVVQTRKLRTNEVTKKTCNAVIVCNGHNAEPNIPKIPGLDKFPGKVIHSIDYRVPEVYANQTVLLLGVGTSGIDISMDVSKFAKKVYLSHNYEKIIGPKKPENIEQVSGVSRAEGNTLILRDGSNVTVDVLIFATGYVYSFPFLDETSGINAQRKFVYPLYKHMINVEHPSMAFMGIILQINNFVEFYVQGKYFAALLRGEFELPNKSTMLQESENMKNEKSPHLVANAQGAYLNELMKESNFDGSSLQRYDKAYVIWREIQFSNSWDFKDYSLHVLDNGDVKLVHYDKQ